MAQETIGFIGAGLMGHGIAANILKKGYPVKVMAHRNRAPVEDIVRLGGTEAHSVAEIVASSSIILYNSSLPITE